MFVELARGQLVNNMSKIYPVLLAGGSGTRLWPVSRKSYPKQFANLLGDKTLFQQSAARLTSSALLNFAAPVTMTNSDFRFIVREQLESIAIPPGPILIEPSMKNTAPAILAASIFASRQDANATLLVAPSDHTIADIDMFHQAISVGLEYVQQQKLVTFGINPTYPETGYGYLNLSNDPLDAYGTSEIKKFLEKPHVDDAKEMLKAGNYLWNAGIFLFQAKDMIEAFQVHSPEIFRYVSEAVSNAHADLGFIRLAAEPWSELEDISIDYAIMEKVSNLVAVPYKSKWSDLGGWDAVWSESSPNKLGNVVSENAHAIDCGSTLLRTENADQHLVGIGLNDIMVVAMSDAVLVAHKERAQDVKKAVTLLKSKNVQQAEIFPKDHRPWGWFESLVKGSRFQVKRIYVNPGAALSLQSHHHRSEHWIVVEGTAKVLIDENVKIISEGESVYVPLGAMHRLENPGKLPLVLIEVQIGPYLYEDDIVRYSDLYQRDEE